MNVKELRDIHNLTQQDVADNTGIPRARIAKWEQGKGSPKADDTLKLKFFFENLFPNSDFSKIKEITAAPPGRFPKKSIPDKPIPFFDVDFAAGDIEFYNGHNTIQAAYTMDIPEFSGCTAFRTYGDSMERLIKSGDILFGTKIEDWQSHLEYGQIYGIITNDTRRYLKYIRKAVDKEETHFLLKSENPEYDDFLIPKSKIKSIWLIHGWMNKRT